MSNTILKANRSYTFADYFELNYPTEDILTELGYQYQLARLTLPTAHREIIVEGLRQTLYKRLPHVSLNSETARREVLVAPVLFELLEYFSVKIDFEYPIYVSERLKGNIDYLVRSSVAFVVVEAKKADMEKGFTQLAVELIAMDQYLQSTAETFYGAITVGDLWRFGVLQRKEKTIYRDIGSFRVPDDLEALFQILIGILQ
jgi:hypothetical protein